MARASDTRSVPTTCYWETTTVLLRPSSGSPRSSRTTLASRGYLLCWTLGLHRAGNEIGAAKKLRQTMFSNLYLVPRLLGSPIAELDIWHGSSDAEPSYAEHIHEPYLQLWTNEERDWAEGLYHSPGFQSVRERYIEIARALDTTRPGPERSRLVAELEELER